MTIIAILILTVKCIVHHHLKNIHLINMHERAKRASARKEIYFHVSESDISITMLYITAIINFLLIMEKCMVHRFTKYSLE